MFCTKCGSPIKDGQKFCVKCGSPVIQGAKSQNVSMEVVEEKAVEEKVKQKQAEVDIVVEKPKNAEVNTVVEEPKKKGKVLPIILIVVAIVLVATIALIVWKIFDMDAQQVGKIEDDGWVSVAEDSDSKTEKETETEKEVEKEKTSVRENNKSASDDEEMDEEEIEEEEIEEEEIEEEIEDFEDGDYILPQSAIRKLTEKDLKRIKNNAWLLKLARNEIFARYGREFNDQALQDYFYSKDWYDPIYGPEEFDEHVSEIVSDMEMKNAKFIKKYEDKLK